jgi:hydroxymethylpyrimidine/phosphomethylpyrimidine kinase
MDTIPKVITIAGSDSGGGAGIQADLKTFSALNVHGCSVITAVTAQNSKEVSAVHCIPLEIIDKQLDVIMVDIGTDAVKIGMLSNREIISAVANKLIGHNIRNIVLDPVMIASSGAKLIEDSAITALKKKLIPISLIITPNIPEAEILIGKKIESIEHMKEAARQILGFGCKTVLLKGGHLPLNDMDVIDIFYDGSEFLEIKNKRINKVGHGTGCTLSSAIAANISKGKKLKQSVIDSVSYVHKTLLKGYKAGEMNYVLDHNA